MDSTLFATTTATETVEAAIRTFAEGGFVVVFDHESRENEGDLMVAAEYTDLTAMRFILDHTSGVVCVAMPARRTRELELPQMVEPNAGLHDTAFTVSVDLHSGTTGISGEERSLTIRALADPATRPGDLARPGHIFPIRAVEGGVFERGGHTEAGVDLSLLAGLSGVTTICEIVNRDWSMTRHDDLVDFAARYSLPIISVADLVAYRGGRQR